jgi:hypothetical protein
MTVSDFTIENVTKEIENWILNYLDHPSEHYNGMKPCPFAKEAWIKNKCHVLIGSEHMVHDPALRPESWGSIIDEAYSLVFVQRLSVVNRISEVLEKMGYYDKLSPEFMQYIKERRGS